MDTTVVVVDPDEGIHQCIVSLRSVAFDRPNRYSYSTLGCFSEAFMLGHDSWSIE